MEKGETGTCNEDAMQPKCWYCLYVFHEECTYWSQMTWAARFRWRPTYPTICTLTKGLLSIWWRRGKLNQPVLLVLHWMKYTRTLSPFPQRRGNFPSGVYPNGHFSNGEPLPIGQTELISVISSPSYDVWHIWIKYCVMGIYLWMHTHRGIRDKNIVPCNCN